MLFEQHQPGENYVLLNRKGFTCSSNMQRVSKEAFWMRGAQLSKQYVYEQAFQMLPTESQDDYTPWHCNTDRAVKSWL